MSLIQTIDTDLIESQKAKDADKTAVLRMLKTNIKNTAIQNKIAESDMSDEQVIAVIRQEVKKRKESADAFTNGGRPELAEKEQAEAELLTPYLPAQMSDDEMQKVIAEVVAEQEMSPPYQFGQLMGAVMKKVAGKADGGAVKDNVTKFIESN